MSLIYHTNRTLKKPSAIDNTIREKRIFTASGVKDTTSEALSYVLSQNEDWAVDSIQFNFSNATSRDYSAKILKGANVIENVNDFLWFQVTNSLWQKITLTSGFYETGASLASELQTQLNANTEFSSLGRTFTVSYSTATGLFTITPSAQQIKYIQTNNTQQLSDRESIAGNLFGLTTSTSFGSNVVSDTVMSIGNETAIISQTGGTATEHYHDDSHVLGVDQALKIASSVAAVSVTYSVSYSKI
jgi:hypothetical protein